MSSNSLMVVCDVFKLFRDGNSFVKESKKLLMKDKVLRRDYAEGKNADYKSNGLWHEIDEEKTKEYYAMGAKKLEKRKKAEKARKRVSEALVDVLDAGAKSVEGENLVIADEDLKMHELRIKYPGIKATTKKDFLAKVAELNKNE